MLKTIIEGCLQKFYMAFFACFSVFFENDFVFYGFSHCFLSLSIKIVKITLFWVFVGD